MQRSLNSDGVGDIQVVATLCFCIQKYLLRIIVVEKSGGGSLVAKLRSTICIPIDGL